MGVASACIPYATPLTLGYDSDYSAQKGNDFVTMTCFRLILGRKFSVVFFAISGGYVKLVNFV